MSEIFANYLLINAANTEILNGHNVITKNSAAVINM